MMTTMPGLTSAHTGSSFRRGPDAVTCSSVLLVLLALLLLLLMVLVRMMAVQNAVDDSISDLQQKKWRMILAH